LIQAEKLAGQISPRLKVGWTLALAGLISIGLAIFCIYRLTHHPAPVPAPITGNPTEIAKANGELLAHAAWKYYGDHEMHAPKSLGVLIQEGYLKEAPPNPFGTGRMHQIRSLRSAEGLAGNYLYCTGTTRTMHGEAVESVQDEFMVVVFGEVKPDEEPWHDEYWGFHLPDPVAASILYTGGGLIGGAKLNGGYHLQGPGLAKCIAAAGVELPEGALDKQ